MSWSIEFAPQIPWSVFWTLAGLAALVGLVILFRMRSGALLRVLTLAALVAALANPILKREQRESLSNIAVVVTDQSASQKIDGRAQRSESIRAELKNKLERVPGLDTRWVDAADSGDGEGTRLFGALEDALGSIPSDRLAGVVMITDGQVHDAPEGMAALGFDAPVHTLLTGRKNEFDRRIHIERAPRYGIVGRTREAEIRVVSHGDRDRREGLVRLRIRREGQADETLMARVGETIPIPFSFPHAGKNIVEIELEAADGELTEANNRIVLTAEGVRENLRVLLVSGEPHAGERTWRNLLKSDASVDLVHFTILRPPEKQDGTPIHQLSLIAFPTRELFQEKLHDFDLIIFDRYKRRGVLPILYLDNIARYVEEHGGAVLVAAGEDYAEPLSLYRTPLSQVLPGVPTGRVFEQPYRAQVTTAGLRHPVTRDLPESGAADGEWGRWFRQIAAEAASGQVVMKGVDEHPLLMLDRRGEGRVALLLSDHAWLWARGLEGGGPYAPLLRRLAHWLMKEPDLEEEFLSATAKGLNLSIERRTMKDDVGEVILTAPSGAERTVTLEEAGPGLWRADIRVDEHGLYKLRSDALTTVVNAGVANSREMAQVTTTEDRLAEVQNGSGGGAFWAVAAGGPQGEQLTLPRVSMLQSAKILHGSSWMGLKDREAHVVRGVDLTPLYAGFLALAALLVLMTATWWREGR